MSKNEKRKGDQMKITFVNPNYDEPRVLKFMGLPSIPLGMAIVAACVEQAGFEVNVVDAFGYRHSIEKTIEEVKKTKPDYVGISCVTCNIDYGIQIAQALRPQAKVILAGTHPSLDPKPSLSLQILLFSEKGRKLWLKFFKGKNCRKSMGLFIWRTAK